MSVCELVSVCFVCVRVIFIWQLLSFFIFTHIPFAFAPAKSHKARQGKRKSGVDTHTHTHASTEVKEKLRSTLNEFSRSSQRNEPKMRHTNETTLSRLKGIAQTPATALSQPATRDPSKATQTAIVIVVFVAATQLHNI